MSFDWLMYLSLAEELHERSDEASLRSAVSRAYYALYGSIAKKLADEEGFEPSPQSDSHRAVWTRLKENVQRKADGRNRQTIGRLGLELRTLRKRADYDEIVKDLPQLSSDALEKARTMRELMNRLQ